jgi:hypothetical protein
MRQNPPAPAANVPLTVIGVIRSAHTEPETTPIQAALNRAGQAAIEIAEPYRDGLAGLDGAQPHLSDPTHPTGRRLHAPPVTLAPPVHVSRAPCAGPDKTPRKDAPSA